MMIPSKLILLTDDTAAPTERGREGGTEGGTEGQREGGRDTLTSQLVK